MKELLDKEKYIDLIRKRITELRIKKNVSEYQMSYDLGKSKGYIQSISSGTSLPSMDAFIDICDYLDISPASFFEFETPNIEIKKEITKYIQNMPLQDLILLAEILKRYSELKK